MTKKTKSEWIAKIQLLAPISEMTIKGVEGIEFDIEYRDTDVILKGFSIKVPLSNPDDAFLYAQEKANRIFDYLSALHRYHIRGFLSNIVEDKPKGETKEGTARISIDMILHKSMDVDFSSIKDILENKDVKLLRQLAHYRMGLESENFVTKVQQFYQVAEDEYDFSHVFIEEYKWVRHIVSHPKLDRPQAKAIAMQHLGKNFVDLSNPTDMMKLEQALKPIEEEARKIIESKLGRVP